MLRASRRTPRTGTALLTLIGLLLAFTPARSDDGARFGVFLRLMDTTEHSVNEVADALSGEFAAHGWTVLADFPTGLDPDICLYEARVLVLYDEAYASAVMQHGPHAAFAVPVRVAVFEDELGVHAAAVNPKSLNRTIVEEDGLDAEWATLAQDLAAVVAGRFPDEAVQVEYGQWRDKGRIGKTFGIMAGGPFPEKIETVTSLPAGGTSVGELARRLEAGITETPVQGSWGIHGAYSVELPGGEVALVGVAGARMESDAFRIVGNGNQKDRDGLVCPGLDHAAAFPVAIALVREGDRIQVQLVDEMFRMKMYFEDAGKMAFAKNMGMPGSIEDEIRAKIEAVLQ